MSNFKQYIKSKRIVFLILFILIALIYLNRSYSYIYENIDEVGFQSSVLQEEYLLDTSSNNTVVYVAIGDSLTAGVGVDDYRQSYPYILSQKISNKESTVLLRPIAAPGARTKDIALLLDEEKINSSDIVTVMSGVNDVYGNVSKDQFENDYLELIENLISMTDAQIYVINLPYIGNTSLILPPYNYYFEYKTKQFNEVIKGIAQENNLIYVDLYSSVKGFSQEESYYSLDNFHPSDIGYKKWANSIYENINK